MINNVMYSGGAIGSDIEWGLMATKLHHVVQHFSFNGHHAKSLTHQTIVLNDDELKGATLFVEKANESLHRKIPKNDYVLKLLQRNFFQIRYSDVIYAIGFLSIALHDDFSFTDYYSTHEVSVEGGTAWAIQMFIDLNRGPIYFFDQNNMKWFLYYNNKWRCYHAIPKTPIGHWTGIGTRRLMQQGKDEIWKIYEETIKNGIKQ